MVVSTVKLDVDDLLGPVVEPLAHLALLRKHSACLLVVLRARERRDGLSERPQPSRRHKRAGRGAAPALVRRLLDAEARRLGTPLCRWNEGR